METFNQLLSISTSIFTFCKLLVATGFKVLDTHSKLILQQKLSNVNDKKGLYVAMCACIQSFYILFPYLSLNFEKWKRLEFQIACLNIMCYIYCIYHGNCSTALVFLLSNNGDSLWFLGIFLIFYVLYDYLLQDYSYPSLDVLNIISAL